MKLLLLGSTGRVGREIISSNALHNFEIITPYSNQMNLADHATLEKIIHIKPDLVINAAAYTDVEEAESNLNQAYCVNRDGPNILVKFCNKLDIPLIHLSTDYVFSGKNTFPYTEDDTPDPINIYGKSKLAGEQAIINSCEKYIILRTSWIFGTYGKNFVKYVLHTAKEKSLISIVDDETSCPTAAISLANAILNISNQILNGNTSWGIYHFCGSPFINRYNFALNILSIAQKFHSKTLAIVRPINSANLSTKARRPNFSAMSTNKLGINFNISPTDWHDELEKLIPFYLNTL